MEEGNEKSNDGLTELGILQCRLLWDMADSEKKVSYKKEITRSSTLLPIESGP